MVRRRRCLFEPAISPTLDLDFVRSRDRFPKILVRVPPQRIARERCRGLLPLFERRIRTKLLSNLSLDHLGDTPRDIANQSRG
jgi:hypothetical protein